MAYFRCGGNVAEEYSGATEITPSTSNQVLATADKLVNSNITVYGDANLVASKIKYGVNIFGVAGSVRQYGLKSGNITSSGSYTFYDWNGGTKSVSRVSVGSVGFNVTAVISMCGELWGRGTYGNSSYWELGYLGTSGSVSQNSGTFPCGSSNVQIPIQHSGYGCSYSVAGYY